MTEPTTSPTTSRPTPVDYGAYDADNHYYEPADAFTRYVSSEMQKRAVHWATIDGRPKLMVGGRVNNFIPNPTFDPIAKPGSLMAYFRGNPDGGDVKSTFGDLDSLGDHPEYRDRDARLAVMDDQQVDASMLFPTLGVGMEQSLVHDPPAAIAAFEGFNRWLHDDWGYAYQDRLFGAPYLCLMDVDRAVVELERVLDLGARVVLVRPAPVPTPMGTRSPFLDEFDPFWARVAEAGVLTAWHGGDTAYNHHVDEWEPTGAGRAFFSSPLSKVITKQRAITETMASALCHRVFERHPRLRFACIENGSMWVSGLLTKLDLAASQSPGWFAETPSEVFRRHIWVAPFWEDDPVDSAQTLGVDNALFGSDWPHAEGIPDPIAYATLLAPLGPHAVRSIMRDNLAGLLADPA